MANNGFLPMTALSAIGSGYYLRRDAAAQFLAMSAEARRLYGTPIYVRSAYRPYSSQVFFWNLYRSGRGNLAAYPGTSNHGLGLAVDLASPHMRWIVDQIGAKYGFSKRWSDAPGEWWHIKFDPAHATARVKRQPQRFPALRLGSRGVWVKRCQNALQRFHIRGAPTTTGYYGPKTRDAVKRLQRKHKLTPDGRVGPQTWTILRKALK